MKSICFFAAYFTGKDLPYYVNIYLKELNRHFTKVVFSCSQGSLSDSALQFFSEENITYFVETNEGFDFGLWYKALQKTDIEDYEQVALVNDSCILFRPLDDFMNWSKADGADLQGMTYSEAIAPHIQSFFLLINKNAIRPVRDFFNSKGIVKNISEVIKTYEVGLSTHLVNKGLSINAYMNKAGSQSEFSPYYSHVKEHLSKGIPLIKKKIIFSTYRKDELFTLARMDFDINPANYIYLINKQPGRLLLSFDELLDSAPRSLSFPDHIKYSAWRLSIRLYRRIKYGK